VSYILIKQLVVIVNLPSLVFYQLHDNFSRILGKYSGVDGKYELKRVKIFKSHCSLSKLDSNQEEVDVMIATVHVTTFEMISSYVLIPLRPVRDR
jgi:hypothetical protein